MITEWRLFCLATLGDHFNGSSRL